MEREYEEAVTDIKAAIFDVVDSEKKTNASLSDMISNEVDDNKKEELSNILNQKKEILDTILSNIDSIIDNVEMLDKINYDNNLKTDYVKSEIETTNTYETEAEEEIEDKTEESEDEEDSDNELEEPIITEEDENEDEEESEESEDEEDSDDIEDIVDVEEIGEKTDDSEDEDSEDEESDDEEPVLTEIKPAEGKIAFNKEDNTAPRAIMVIEAQEKKLKDSYDKQLDKVKTIGLFDDYNYDNSTKNTLAGDVINEDVAAKLNLEGKSIEDLTVLKQVYSDEGEVEAVKVIEAKMKELEEQTENTSE